MKTAIVWIVALMFLPHFAAAAKSSGSSKKKTPSNYIQLKNADGTLSDYVGIWDAWSSGLWAAGDPREIILVAWDKLDLADLDARHPKILGAKISAQHNQCDEPINLGIFRNTLTSLQAARFTKRTLCKPLSWKIPEKQLARIKSALQSRNSYNFSAQYNRRTPALSADGTFTFTPAKSATAAIAKIQSASVPNSLIGLLTYASFGDNEKQDVQRVIKANAKQLAALASELRQTLACTKLYPKNELIRHARESGDFRARHAQKNLPRDAATLAWLNNAIDDLDQVTLVNSIAAFAQSLELAGNDIDAQGKAFSDLKTLLRVLDRPFVR